MRIIISPAKKMRVDTDTLPHRDMPIFLDKAKLIRKRLEEMSSQDLKKLWKCNDQILQQNIQRLEEFDLERNLTPALLAYEGIQYQYMAPGVFTTEQFQYVQEHLRILSGLYGLLRPFDGVIPYRLEMQAKLSIQDVKDLYQFWGDSLADQLYQETDCIINLASKEYSQCISKYPRSGTQFITCVFGELIQGKIVEKGTMCKMARGEMVRYLGEIGGEHPRDLKEFDRLDYHFSPEHSNEASYVFLRNS